MKQFVTTDGCTVTRVSRWIKVQHNYNPNRANSLWDYVTDLYGYNEHSEHYNPRQGLVLDFFRFDGQTFALSQFGLLGGPWAGGQPLTFTDTDGKLTVISGYDMDNYYSPLLMEMDEYGEYIRLYKEV